MPETPPRETSEVFERYALGLARRDGLPLEDAPAASARRRAALAGELLRRGAGGWPERRTFYTRTMPAGCLPCVRGRGSNLCLTTLCNRDCFFCFNPRPRAEAMSVHGKAVGSEDEVPGILETYGIRSLGLSGGEPLLDPERVLRVLRLLRKRFGGSLRVDLYTNGDLFSRELLRRLRDAGLDALRVNLVAGGYRVEPVALALGTFRDVEVEIPAIPSHGGRLRDLVDALDALGAPHLVLHELFCSAENIDSLRRLGHRAAAGGRPEGLTWGPIAGSEETALETMLYTLGKAKTLSVYYCSCGTQDWIAANALKARGEPAA